MDITWLGHAAFRIRSKEATIITDPYNPEVGFSIGKPTADIVTVSHQHYDHNNVSAVAGEPKVISGPGEYEIKGVQIIGIQSYHDAEGGQKRGKNTIYVIQTDDMSTCHLGDLGHIPTSDQVQLIGNIDILMVPVGGVYTLNGSQAAEVVNLLEPRIVIPMHFKTPQLKVEVEPIDRFLREMGLKQIEPQPKLTVNRSTLPAETTVVLLSSQRG